MPQNCIFFSFLILSPQFCSSIMSHSVDSLDDRLHPRPLPPAPHHGLGVDHPWPPGHQLPPHGGAPPPPPHSTIPPPPPPPLGGGGLCDSPLSKSGEEVPLCAGCRLRIVDQFFLLAVEQKWHAACLKCVECGVQLDSQMSCFEKNGAILCKEDYLR